MTRKRAVLNGVLAGVALCLTSCADDDAEDESSGRALEQAAVERGLIPSKEAIIFAGRYERRSDIGADKFCATDDGGDHKIGLLAIFGAQSWCEARGTAHQEGESVEIALKGRGDCRFEARFDGIELVFPGRLPNGCARYCSDRASLSGVSFYFVESGDAAARSTTGRSFKRLCD